jgi:hypothetical protein
MDYIKQGITRESIKQRGVHIAELIAANYEIGDAVVVDTTNGDRYFGFYAGLTEFPQNMVMVAKKCVNFNGAWDKKWFDGISSVATTEIAYFNATPVKQSNL